MATDTSGGTVANKVSCLCGHCLERVTIAKSDTEHVLVKNISQIRFSGIYTYGSYNTKHTLFQDTHQVHCPRQKTTEQNYIYEFRHIPTINQTKASNVHLANTDTHLPVCKNKQNWYPRHLFVYKYLVNVNGLPVMNKAYRGRGEGMVPLILNPNTRRGKWSASLAGLRPGKKPLVH
jgi:hypothetical protein